MDLTQACLCAAVLLAIILYAARARTFKGGLPMQSCHEPILGSTRSVIKQVLLSKNSTLTEFVLNEFRTNGWQAFAWSAIGGKVGIAILEREDIKFLLKDQFNDFVKAPDFISNFEGLLGKGIFNTNGEVWKEQRVVSSQLFNRRLLRERMSVVFGTHAQDIVRLLSNVGTEAVNIQTLFYCFTFDCINSVAFNKNVNSLEGDVKDCEFQNAFDVIQAGVLSRFLVPWWKVNRLLGLPTEHGISSSLKVVNAYVEEVVDLYFEKDGTLKEDAIKDDRTITGLFLDYAQSSGTSYDRVFIRDMILNTVIAGRDTTGSALTSCIQLLCDYPEWQEKLHAEALECFGGNTQEALTFDDLESRSPVAEAVFLEALRLHPSVPGNEKIALRETTFPSGFTVPAGTAVGWVPHATNRYEKLWGADAEEFNPARWIDKTYDDFMYPTFNAGPRLCLGKNMAILEGKTALLTIFAHFRFSLRKGFKPQLQSSVTWQLDSKGLEVMVHPW